MEIRIQFDEETLILTNEDMNNDNFVDIGFSGKELQTVPIEELYSAVKAFYERRIRMQRFDNLLK